MVGHKPLVSIDLGSLTEPSEQGEIGGGNPLPRSLAVVKANPFLLRATPGGLLRTFGFWFIST